jgi:hexosaminidase
MKSAFVSKQPVSALVMNIINYRTMKSIWLSLFILLTITLSAQEVQIIPHPVKLQTQTGSFNLSSKTSIVFTDEGEKASADFFNLYLKQLYGFTLPVSKQAKSNSIRLVTRRFVTVPDNEGRYTLKVTPAGITIEGDSYQGNFYGIQTLIQLLPVKPATTLAIPAVSIEDYPRFQYRGLHLDVGRHFFPVDFLKKYIDYIALHKLNYFHWHLTEDQGWRIEIKKYPRLTEVGAYRNGTIIGRYPGTGNDNIRYGGFYTQEQVKEVVKYASDRYITVIPEIEMPGHSSAALTAYPSLGCPGTGPYKVEETWGVFNDVFCGGNDSVFTFLQDVLDEVMPLFPARYVHIGGDESPKENWKTCPRCQQRIKDHKLKDEHGLQSYFIQRIEKYVNAKGKQIIGWDEILEGGLAPNAVVMSWRGEQGGIAAAKEKHNVIMTPGSHVYFDHAQSRNEDSVTIGSYLPLEKVYSYEPVPAALTAEEAKYVLGAQANMWTEYMKNTRKVEYMLFPRIAALSEVLWTPKEKKSWPDFEKRMVSQFKRYDLWGVNYSRAYYAIQGSVSAAPGNKGLLWTLSSKATGKSTQIQVSHGTDDKVKQRVNVPDWKNDPDGSKGLMRDSIAEYDYRISTYTKPILVSGNAQYVASLLMKEPSGKISSISTITQNFSFNKATGKKITLKTPPSSAYVGEGGAFGLVNGLKSERGISSTEWQAWSGKDMEAVIDLGTAQEISKVSCHMVESRGSWIYRPTSVEVATSNDGKTFTNAGTSSEFVFERRPMGNVTVTFPAQKARYVRVMIKNPGVIAANLPGAGNPAWIFVDEIEVH